MMSRKKTIALAITLAIVAAIAGMLLSRALMQRAETSDRIALVTGTLLDPARPLPQFELVDHEAQHFTNERLRDHWTFLFFGFTHCPDVCPTTLRMLSQVEQSLADVEPQLRPRVTLISVDPKRDTPEQLAKYVSFFNPQFVGVTGSEDALNSFTRQIGVPVAITPSEDGAYTVDHSAAIFLIDPSGAIRALFSPPHSPQTIADDYRRIVKSSR
jgi:protein SCO1